MTDTETTLEDLRKRASELDIPGRSKMDAEELAAAIATAEDRGPMAADVDDDVIAPGTPEEVGRPEAIDVAEKRAANRNPRVVGAPKEA